MKFKLLWTPFVMPSTSLTNHRWIPTRRTSSVFLTWPAGLFGSLGTSFQSKLWKAFLSRVLHLTSGLRVTENIIHTCPPPLPAGWLLKMLENSWEANFVYTPIQYNELGMIMDSELGRWFCSVLFVKLDLLHNPCWPGTHSWSSCFNSSGAGIILTCPTIPWWRNIFACVCNMYVYISACTWIHVRVWKLETNTGYHFLPYILIPREH